MRTLTDIMAEQASADADDRDLRSRTDARFERLSLEEDLEKLGKALIGLSKRKLVQLELPEAVFDAVADAQNISSAIARNRQVRVVRSRLRDADWATIKQQLETLLLHGTTKPAAPSPAPKEEPSGKAAWAIRLVTEGAEAVEAFLVEYPTADRSQLRQVIRNIQKASAETRTKATQKLTQLIAALTK